MEKGNDFETEGDLYSLKIMFYFPSRLPTIPI